MLMILYSEVDIQKKTKRSQKIPNLKKKKKSLRKNQSFQNRVSKTFGPDFYGIGSKTTEHILTTCLGEIELPTRQNEQTFEHFAENVEVASITNKSTKKNYEIFLIKM